MFYFWCIVIVLFNIVLYANFRSGIYDYFRLSKMSKSNIKKSRKGFRNYWFYESINKKSPLGILYNLNYIYLTATVAFSVPAVLLGYIKALQPTLFVLSIILCIIEIPSTILSSTHSNIAEFGKPFVLLVRRSFHPGHRGPFYSSLIDIFSWVVTALFIYFSYLQL